MDVVLCPVGFHRSADRWRARRRSASAEDPGTVERYVEAELPGHA
jgi:hypothetical protein